MDETAAIVHPAPVNPSAVDDLASTFEAFVEVETARFHGALRLLTPDRAEAEDLMHQAPPPVDVPVVDRAYGLGDFPELPTTMIESARWQSMLDARIDQGKLPGVAATVILADQGIWSGSAGTADGVNDLVPDAQFAIASLTKTVIAAQVLRLAEDGAIDLEAPAADYLPAEVPLDPNGATVRQLLGMRGGIVDPPWRKGDWGWGPGWIPLDPTRRWTLMETLEGFAAAGTDYVAAGGRPRYSNASYALLEALIEHVEGRPIAAVLRSNVLAQDGLERLIMQVDERPTEPLAQPLTDVHPDALAAAFEAGGGYLPTAFDASLNTAHGGMASDTASLARWLYLLFGGDVLSDASLQEMTGAEQVPTDSGRSGTPQAGASPA